MSSVQVESLCGTKRKAKSNWINLTLGEIEYQEEIRDKEVQFLREKIEKLKSDNFMLRKRAEYYKQMALKAKGESAKIEENFDIFKRASQKLENYRKFEIDDQRHLLVNMCKCILSDGFSLRGITFNMISTLIRGNLPPVDHQNSQDGKKAGFFIYFKDKEIQISSKEKELFKNFQSNQLLLGMLTGQVDSWLKEMNTKAEKDPASNCQRNSDDAEGRQQRTLHTMDNSGLLKHGRSLVPKFE
ncbi:unnamed protein product [Moneuplotes crassus]|uniref:Uncharacterized protein n=1 Tax=Euplotes crassus TaxID=5936 RepID=A0AAD2CW76_EUPCR|nr:unnamed protein product [Moneuplotes crassus]